MDQIDNFSMASINEKEIENNLKDLLERVLLNIEKFIETKEELNQVEAELKDYESLTHLIGIIKAVFTNLMMKVEKKISKLEKQIDPNHSITKSLRSDEEYEKLEQTLIKYESEIRNHIRIEQQLKLYAESIQSKLDESESSRAELLETTKKLISNLKRENQSYHETQQKLNIEIASLKQVINNLEKDNRKKSLDLGQRDYLKKNQQPIIQQLQLQNQRNQKSYSEHKLNSQINHTSNTLETNEIPIKSQQSLKQNYYNIINYGHQGNKGDVLKVIQQKDLNKIYGQKLKSKNNSLSTIQDLIQSVSVQDRKKGIISQPVSKNSSQNNSQIQKYKETCDQSRSKSSRRANIGTKHIQIESQIKLTS
ncbi:unnamed protein product (macronuclear) [Paramecium tetraurelia]|uniref:Uncharacterized protein n=1 Tax=Paramecium tetraurelia TaxID=5888 RepID=A0ECM7_PARTE|nr:uncharacterized protein GSPATT00003913001 [Paramecium tetraurelia]CAK93044.1 unnamed protein product [Paramecium tetraurelia]|eukprot:XP_001460441.1 hypothetical protein (macronuclear) [Paramecium tetraurelia strain d4-2]